MSFTSSLDNIAVADQKPAEKVHLSCFLTTVVFCHLNLKTPTCTWKEMAVQVSNCCVRLALFAEPYKGDSLVLAPLVPQQLLSQQIAVLREESAQFFLADALGNISNVEIGIFDICSVGSTVRHLDPLVGYLQSIESGNCFGGILGQLIVHKAVAVTVARTFIPHDFCRHNLTNRDEHSVKFIVSHRLRQIVDD